MKKLLTAGLLAAIVLSSCQNENLGVVVQESKTFVATIEDNGTNTSLDEFGNVLWKRGDRVSIFVGSTINEQYQVNEESDGQTSANMNAVSPGGFVAGGEIDNNVAYYPYSTNTTIAKNAGGYSISGITLPATQNYATASFGNGAFPMAAVTTTTSDYNLKFRNVLGGLKLQLKGTASIVSVSVRGNNDEILCGPAIVSVSNGNTPTIALSDVNATTVTLDCGAGVQLDAENATSFIIALPPMTMTAGFTVVVTDTEGKQMEIASAKSHNIARSGLLRMPAVTYVGVAPAPAYEYVDLGLSVKWATFNVGATAPEEYGDYFAWGETEPYYEPGYAQENPQAHWKAGKSEGYNWSTYKYCNGRYSGELTKYCSDSDCGYNGYTDSKTVLDPEDDAAHVNWGGSWRMPTQEEQNELRNEDNCTWTWTTLNGVKGYKVQSKKSGYTDKWIFLPAAGCRYYSNLANVGESSFYWSSSLNRDDSPYYLYFDSSIVARGYGGRWDGLSVRPVWQDDPNSGITGVSLDKSATSIIVGYDDLKATVSKNAGAVNTQVEWNSSNTSVATVDYSGKVTAVSVGTATITAKTVFGGFTATCTVTVTPFIPTIPVVHVYEYVDLGLSVKWATFNIGASKPEEYGDYFAWGATEPLYEAGYALDKSQQHWKDGKSDGYTFVNTPYQTANTTDYSSTKWTKYLGSTSSYNKDPSATDANALKTVLDPEDDAAHVNWGGSWRMPTQEEQNELRNRDNCTWTWTTLNGVNGYKVQSKKSGYTDKWIFLPAAGYRNGSYLGSVGESSLYWSSSLSTYYPYYAYYLYFDSSYVYGDKIGRYGGHSVRPVCP